MRMERERMDKGIGCRRWKSERLGCRSRELWRSSSLVLKLFIFLLLLFFSLPSSCSLHPSLSHPFRILSFPAMDDVHLLLLLLLSFLSPSSSFLFFLSLFLLPFLSFSLPPSFSFSFNSFLSSLSSLFVWREVLV